VSADDVAAVREALKDQAGYLSTLYDDVPAYQRRLDALAALDRLAARLQASERSEITAHEEWGLAEKRALAAEAREAALREALEAAQPWLMVSSDTYPQHHETLVRVHAQVRAALAADDAP